MNRQEFIEILRRELVQTGNDKLVDENIRYYNYYFDNELAKGRNIDEILNELGDPRLIANTIKTAAGYEETFAGSKNSYNGSYNSDADNRGESANEDIFDKVKNTVSDNKATIDTAIKVAIFLAVLFVVFVIVKKIFLIFWPIIAIYLIWKFVFRSK